MPIKTSVALVYVKRSVGATWYSSRERMPATSHAKPEKNSMKYPHAAPLL